MKYCKKCGDTVPEGKELCWVCEHTPKLHKMEEINPKEKKCSEDACSLEEPERSKE